MIKKIDSFLNGTTMYKVVLYVLLLSSSFAIILGFLGLIHFEAQALLLSVILFTLFCYIFNTILSKVWGAPVNAESAVITGLILFFIFPPVSNLSGIIFIALASFVAMATKYVLSIRKRHLFNPAAASAVIISLFTNFGASWWVGNSVMFPIIFILGLLVVRKMRKFSLVLTFILISISILTIYGMSHSFGFIEIIEQAFYSWPIIFFAFIMLTEPQTLPPTKKLQIAYAVIVGVIFASQWHIGSIYPTPEIALIIGNIFAFIVGFKRKIIARLEGRRELDSNIYHFRFTTDSPITFTSGQYMEWTLPHDSVDVRGNRRFFTVASSPTEGDLQLGIKIPNKPSSFKKRLLELKEGDTIIASGLAGDFVLPNNREEKIVGIAGGIGITPFRSMVKNMIDSKERRDMTIFYCGMTENDFTYKDLMEEGGEFGIRMEYIVTKPIDNNWQGKTGYLTGEIIKESLPDYLERTFYISGPDAMVTNYKKMLRSIGISRWKIKADYFPGFA